MPEPNLPAAIEANLARLGTEKQIAQAAYNSGAAQAYMALGATVITRQAAVRAIWEFYQLSAWVRDTKAWRFYAADGSGDQKSRQLGAKTDFAACKNFDEFLDVYGETAGVARGQFRAIEALAKQFGESAAETVIACGLPRQALRALPCLDPTKKGQVKKLIAECGGDADALAAQIAELVLKKNADDRSKREEAILRAQDEAKKASFAEQDALRAKDKLKLESQKLAVAVSERDGLREKLDALPFQTNELSILESVRTQIIAQVGNFERAADSLVAKLDTKGGPPIELVELALHIAELAVNLWGQALGKYLPALDPGQTYTAVWAANAFFQTPGTKADLDQFQADIAAASKKGSQS